MTLEWHQVTPVTLLFCIFPKNCLLSYFSWTGPNGYISPSETAVLKQLCTTIPSILGSSGNICYIIRQSLARIELGRWAAHIWNNAGANMRPRNLKYHWCCWRIHFQPGANWKRGVCPGWYLQGCLDRCYYPCRLRDSVSPICGIFVDEASKAALSNYSIQFLRS